LPRLGKFVLSATPPAGVAAPWWSCQRPGKVARAAESDDIGVEFVGY
jgi:hypothetical protein